MKKMNTLIYPLQLFQELLRTLVRERDLSVYITVGVNSSSLDHEWLVRGEILTSLPNPLISQEPVFRITPASQPFFHDDVLPPGLVGDLVLGVGPWRGHFSGIVRIHERIKPLHRLFLVGSGMYRLQSSDILYNDSFDTQHPNSPPAFRMRWSRTVGAFGDQAIWERLIELEIAIIGCGRTGSLVAGTLARSGIRRLILIDPDVVEEHNLGEMDMATDADIGDYKAEAVAKKFRSSLSSPMQEFTTIASSVTDTFAINACRRAHILFCCVDSDAARLTTAVLATLYHKVLVDIGTGIFLHGQNISNLKKGKEGDLQDQSSPSSIPTHRTMGADIRLVLPADGCLLCRGNLTDYVRAVEEICHSRPMDQKPPWDQQRSGSLRTLNQMAAALGVQMLQDLVAERLQTSTWTHLAFDDTGRLSVSNPSFQSPALHSCPLCPRAGFGDAALRMMK